MPAKAKKSKLSPKQERFCQEILIDWNASAAARRAGYSEKTARQIGAQLLSKLNIQDRIAELRLEQEQRTEITADSVLREFAKYAFKGPGNYECEEQHSLRALENLGRHFSIYDDKLTHQFDFSAATDDELKTIVRGGS